MRLADLDEQIPGLLAARKREHLNRAMAFAGITWTLLGCECRQLTPRTRLELQMGRNALAIGMRPFRGDVFQFLWRMNPAFRKRLTPATWLPYLRLKRMVRRLDYDSAYRAIHEYLAAMLQDLPEARDSDGNRSSEPQKYLHWMATESLFFITQCRMSYVEYLDTPYLILQQWHRAYRLSNEQEPRFINASDQIAAAWISNLAKRGRHDD